MGLNWVLLRQDRELRCSPTSEKSSFDCLLRYADAPEIQQVPKCTFAWIAQEDRDPYPEEASVLVPLYASTTREKLVSQLLLPCQVGEKPKWIVAGVALFLSEN